MIVRKMLIVCVLAVVAILPLVGCKGKADKPAGSGSGARSSNTTTAE
jgi:hypothetical protein